MDVKAKTTRARTGWMAGSLLVLATLAAYHNSFGVPFVFDDLPSIMENPSIRQLWPLSEPLSPPKGFGFTVSGRPLLNLSLAVNHALGGTNVVGYHVFNFVIHALAGLTLFGLVRRTLMRPVVSEKLRRQALPVALVTALLWLVHPLQTESVTYVIQRAESLMALFYLLTLYAFVRGVESPAATGESEPTGTSRVALALSVVACVAGMACKEVMVTAPVVVALYDRTFVAGSFRAAWVRRRGYYVLLALTWGPLLWLVASAGGNRGGTFVLTWTAFAEYWLTQFEAVTRYVQLSFWPSPLVFEYGLFKVRGWREVLPYVGVVAVLVAGTGWALWRRRPEGFLGAAFFLVLAPTSVMPGVTQIIVEHRMYLPLAAVLAWAVGSVAQVTGRRGLLVLLGVAVVAGILTARRNQDYADDLTLWSDSVRKRPQSAFAQSNLGTAYFQKGQIDQALAHFQASERLNPHSPQTQFNLGLAYDRLGQWEEAAGHYRAAVNVLPYFAQARSKLGTDLVKLGKYDEALEHLRIGLSYIPEMTEAHLAMGAAFERRGDLSQAAASYENALTVEPESTEALSNLGGVLFKLGQFDRARRVLERALGLAPTLAGAHYQMGLVLAATGQAEAAQAHYREAIRLDPTQGEARLNLGIALAQGGELEAARRELEQAVHVRPKMPEIYLNLGNVLLELGRMADAGECYREALQLRPDYAVAHFNLGNVLAMEGRRSEARKHFGDAVRIEPGMRAAREALERLRAEP